MLTPLILLAQEQVNSLLTDDCKGIALTEDRISMDNFKAIRGLEYIHSTLFPVLPSLLCM